MTYKQRHNLFERHDCFYVVINYMNIGDVIAKILVKKCELNSTKYNFLKTTR